MEGQIGRIRTLLQAGDYHMNETWLNDCLDYYHNENPNADDNETLTFVTGQWLLSDLREISHEKGCLPANLSQQKFTKLSGKYILQVEKGYDISTSKYKQLETMRKVSNENISIITEEQSQPWDVKANRMMQLFLTDGVQSISAIEYKPIRFLKDMILPGFKIMIKGPVICRKGLLLLEESNLVEIGGEVEHLLIKNATENVFARVLNMSENPDPYNDKNKPESNDPATLFDDDFEVDFDEVSQLESTGQIQSAIDQAPLNQQQGQTAKSPSTMSRVNARKFINPVDYIAKSSTEQSVCLAKQAEIDETQMEIDGLEFPDDDDDDELFALVGQESLISSIQGKNQTHFLGENTADEKLWKIGNTSKNYDNLAEKSENFGERSKNRRKIEEDSWKKYEKSKDKSKNSSINHEDKINDDNLIIISDKETRIFQPAISIKSPRRSTNAISPTMNVEEFGDSDWDEIKFELDAQKSIVSSYKCSETIVNEKSINSTITKSTEIGEKSETCMAKAPRSFTPMSKTCATSSMPLRSTKSKKGPKLEEHSRTLFDYFKKTSENSNAPPRKAENLPEICDFICEINEKTDECEKIIRKKFYIKMTKLQQLTREEAGWLLQGTITDGTGYLDVKFASQVLDKQFGFTAAEFSQKKRESKKNKELMNELRQTFREAELRLNNLDGMVEVEFDGEVPRVVRVEEISETKREEIRKVKRQMGYC